MHGMGISIFTNSVQCPHTGMLEFYLPCQLFFYENWILNFYMKNIAGREQVRNGQRCLRVCSVLRLTRLT
jgi:hypothetical protein